MVEYEIINADVIEGLKRFENGVFDTCITSPPYYGLRDYGVPGQIGLEKTVEEYIERIVDVFREVRRVLKDDGTVWINVGDSYATGTTAARKQSKNPGVGANRKEAQNSVPRIGTPAGCKTKDLIGVPWLLAFALRADGWYLRQDIIWEKPNPMPESVRDRCTKSHEYIFLLSKSPHYYFDIEAIKERAVSHKRQNTSGIQPPKAQEMKRLGIISARSNLSADYERDFRNKRDVWTVPLKGFHGAHFAVFPPDLIRPCVLAGSRRGGNVLDPFAGSGTTVYVAVQEGRSAVGIELNSEYAELARQTIESNVQQISFCQII